MLSGARGAGCTTELVHQLTKHVDDRDVVLVGPHSGWVDEVRRALAGLVGFRPMTAHRFLTLRGAQLAAIGIDDSHDIRFGWQDLIDKAEEFDCPIFVVGSRTGPLQWRPELPKETHE